MYKKLNIIKKCVICVIGFAVMQIDFVISKAVYSSITEINDTGYITKIMMLANDSTIYNYIDRTNYFLYMPTFIFFYAAIACSNISLYRMPRNEMQMQVLRLGSMGKWFWYRLKTVIMDSVLYFTGFIIGCAWNSTICVNDRLMLSVFLRFVWNISFSCLILFLLRKTSKTMGVFITLILSVLLMLLDLTFEETAIISYCDNNNGVLFGGTVAIIIFGLFFAINRRKLGSEEVI